MKLGWLTSESHLTAGLVIAGALIMSGHVDPADRDSLAGMLDVAITRVVGALTAVVPVLRYLHERTKLKLKDLDRAEEPLPLRRGRRRNIVIQLAPETDPNDDPNDDPPPRAA